MYNNYVLSLETSVYLQHLSHFNLVVKAHYQCTPLCAFASEVQVWFDHGLSILYKLDANKECICARIQGWEAWMVAQYLYSF